MTQQHPAPTGTLTPTGVVALTVVFSVPSGLLCYSFGFLASYFMREQVGWREHATFAAIGLVALTATWLGSWAVARRLHPRPAAAGRASLAVSAVPHLVFAAAFGFFTASHLSGSFGLGAAFATVCVVAAVAAARTGWRLLQG